MQNGKDKVYDLKNAEEGTALFERLLGEQDELTSVATVVVRYAAFKRQEGRDALIDFIGEIFKGMDVVYGADETQTMIVFYDRSGIDGAKVEDILNRCVLLNTYFKHYFYPTGEVTGFCTYFGIHQSYDKLLTLATENIYDASESDLVINDLVRRNSSAKGRITSATLVGKDPLAQNVYEYSVVIPELAKALNIKAKRK